MTFFISDGYQKKIQENHQDPQKNGKHEIKKFSYWHDIVCEEFVQLDCEKLTNAQSDPFEAELRGGTGLSSMKFAEVVASPHKIVRTKKHISHSTEDDFLISFQLSSEGIVRQNGREAILMPGSFALYDSTQPYTLSFKDQFHQLVVQMPKEVLRQHLSNPEQYTAIEMCGRAGLGAVITNFVLSLAKEMGQLTPKSEELSDNMLHIMAMAFSSSVMLDKIGNDSLVKHSIKQRVYRYIELNLYNPDISNQMIADAQGISLRYLNKLFSKESDSVHALILEKRLNKSLSMIKNPAYSGHSIESIAYSMGFSSGAHFSRSFKKRFGFNPSQAR